MEGDDPWESDRLVNTISIKSVFARVVDPA